MAQKIFITAREVADRLHMTRGGFLGKRHELEDDHSFPQPMPTSSRPLLWRADQVDRWIDNQGLPRDEAPGAIDPGLLAGGSVALLSAARKP